MDNVLEVKRVEELEKIDKYLDKVLELRKAVKDAKTMDDYNAAVKLFNTGK
jgi:hypothetical protein